MSRKYRDSVDADMIRDKTYEITLITLSPMYLLHSIPVQHLF